MAQQDFLCVCCAELMQSQNFVNIESDNDSKLSKEKEIPDSQCSETAEIYALLSALSSNPPRVYEVTETQYFQPDTECIFRVQRLVENGVADKV